jgi:hypothetical protein
MVPVELQRNKKWEAPLGYNVGDPDTASVERKIHLVVEMH